MSVIPICNFESFKFPEANQPGIGNVQALHAAPKKFWISVTEGKIRLGKLGDSSEIVLVQNRFDLRWVGKLETRGS